MAPAPLLAFTFPSDACAIEAAAAGVYDGTGTGAVDFAAETEEALRETERAAGILAALASADGGVGGGAPVLGAVQFLLQSARTRDEAEAAERCARILYDVPPVPPVAAGGGGGGGENAADVVAARELALGRAYRRRGSLEAALASFDAAADALLEGVGGGGGGGRGGRHRDRAWSALHHERALAYSEMGDKELALRELELAIVEEPRSFDSWSLRASVLMALESYDDAADAARTALSLHPHLGGGEVARLCLRARMAVEERADSGARRDKEAREAEALGLPLDGSATATATATATSAAGASFGADDGDEDGDDGGGGGAGGGWGAGGRAGGGGGAGSGYSAGFEPSPWQSEALGGTRKSERTSLPGLFSTDPFNEGWDEGEFEFEFEFADDDDTKF